MTTSLSSWPVLALLAAALTACNSDSPTDVSQTSQADTVTWLDVCIAQPTAGGVISRILASGLAEANARGDYLTTLHVSRSLGAPNNVWEFQTITDALAAARAIRTKNQEQISSRCPITVVVAPGVYPGTTGADTVAGLEHFPMLVDVPDIHVYGEFVEAKGVTPVLPDSASMPLLVPTEPLTTVDGAPTPLVVAFGHPGGSAGNGFVMAGFNFRSGHDSTVTSGGQAVLSLRASGIEISDNRFGPRFDQTLDLRVGTALVRWNTLGGTADCDICFSGPGGFGATGNNILGGAIAGIILSGAVNLPVPAGVEPFDPPDSAVTWYNIFDNQVALHDLVPVGVGIRVDAVGVGAPDVHNTIHALVKWNTLWYDRFGMIVHAGFPVAGSALQSNVNLTLEDNSVFGSCQTWLLVSLSRHETALGLKHQPYLTHSTFRVSVEYTPTFETTWPFTWLDAWYDNPDGYDNALIVDGVTIANGTWQQYSATTCPGPLDRQAP